MIELSLHILDIVQNSLQAGANEIAIQIIEQKVADILRIEIADNGKGMSDEEIKNCLNPFYSTKSKKTGLGIPLLKQNAEQTEGSVQIVSQKNKDTQIIAKFGLTHIDRQPLGDMVTTLLTIIRANPGIKLTYQLQTDRGSFKFNTDIIRKELKDIPLNNPSVLKFLKEYLTESVSQLKIE